MTLDNLLTPTLLVGTISGILALIQFNRSSSLKYITEERQQWRPEIREIIEEVEGSTDEWKIRPTLSKLKGRINSYGLNYSKSYSKDYHIWQIIRQLEQPKNADFFSFDKQLLINFLALLLKNDWERSKIEIKGNQQKNFNNILFIISILLFAFMSTTDFKEMLPLPSTDDGDQLSVDLLLPVISYFGISIIIFSLIWFGPKIALNSLINKQKDQTFKLTIKQINRSIYVSKVFTFGIPIVTFLIMSIVGPIMILDLSNKLYFFTSVFIKVILLCILWVLSSISNFELSKEKFINLQEYYFSIDSLISTRERDLYPGNQICCSYKINKNEMSDFE